MQIWGKNKKNKRIHGYGIKNIINIVEKNEGHYNIECSDNEFCFSIIIPQIHSLTSWILLRIP